MNRKVILLLMVMICYCIGFAQQYTHTINFRTTDLNQPIDRIEVENLTRETKVTVPANSLLMLRSPVGVEDLNKYEVKPLNVYPNPSKGSANFSFQLANSGDVSVVVYSIVGRAIFSYQDLFESGSHQLRLSGLKDDIYLISVKTKHSESIGKLLVFNSNENGNANISLIGSSDFKSTDSKMLSEQGEDVVMDYTNGDKLLFTAISGKNITIIGDSPTESKDVVVKFIECVDMDGNNYGVVQIGKYFLMAENLKATKDRAKSTMTRISVDNEWAGLANNNTAKAFCIYDNLTANAATYGNLYTYAAAVEAMPLNFRLPTKAEMMAIGETLGDLLDAGGMLKGLNTWNAPNYGASNQSGFNAVAGGCRNATGEFAGMGLSAQFMLADEGENGSHAYATLQNTNSELLMSNTKYTTAISVRGIYELEDISVLQNLFGNNASPKPPMNEGTPLPKKTTFMSNDAEIFVFGSSTRTGTNHPNSPLIPERPCLPDGNQTGTPIETNLPAISSVENKWWHNIKKTAAINNEFGKQDLLVAVWDAETKYTVASHNFGSKPVTLKILRREDPNSNNLTEIKSVKLSETFRIPNMNVADEYAWFRYTENRMEQVDFEWDMLTADINGDGVDEIILTVHDQMYIYSYDGKTFTLLKQKSFKNDHNVADNQAFYLKVRVADMDKNGTNDLCVMTSAMYSGNNPILHVYFNADLVNNNNHMSLSVTSPTNHGYRGTKTATFAVDDIDQDGNYEVIVCHVRDYWYSNTWLSYYKFDPEKKEFKQQSEVSIPSANGNIYSEMTDIKTARLEGPAGNVYIVFGKNITCFNKNTKKFDIPSYIVHDAWRSVWGTQIAVGNFDNDPSGREVIYLITKLTNPNIINDYDGLIRGRDLLKISVDLDRKFVFTRLDKFCNSPLLYSDFFDGEWGHFDGNMDRQLYQANVFAVNTKKVCPILEYVGYEYTMTKPTIDAVVSVAPHYPDYMTGNVGTSWGKSTTSGTETASEYTHTASLIFGYEQEVSIFGVKIAGIEFEAKASLGFSQGFSNSTSVTKAISYTASDENAVVVTSIPYDSYFYKILSSGNPDEVGKEMQFSFPRKPITQILSVESYNKIVEDTPDYPKIDEDVLKHATSDPTTYPTGWNGHSNVVGDAKFEMNYGEMNGVGNTGDISKSIEINSEMAQSKGLTWGFEAQLVGQAGGFKAGVGYSYNNSNTVTNSVGVSMDVSGTVPGIPAAAPTTIKRFDWDLMWYNYQKQGQRFHVINYYVIPQGK